MPPSQPGKPGVIAVCSDPLRPGLDCEGGSLIDQPLLRVGAHSHESARVAQSRPHMLQGMVNNLAAFPFVESRDRLVLETVMDASRNLCLER